jgi:hypothetical protein
LSAKELRYDPLGKWLSPRGIAEKKESITIARKARSAIISAHLLITPVCCGGKRIQSLSIASQEEGKCADHGNLRLRPDPTGIRGGQMMWLLRNCIAGAT